MKPKNPTKAWERMFYSCPGALYGNAPTETVNGNIVVDVAAVHRAVVFIERSRYFRVGAGDAKQVRGYELSIPVMLKG